MKLRNKKTGEIIRFYDGITLNGEDYESLAELNEEWEDYEPKEPLIKDEKVRKVVRAWAEAVDLRWFKRCVSVSPHTSRLYGQDARGIGYTIELKPSELYGDLIDKKGYTLAELCGEEEN